MAAILLSLLLLAGIAIPGPASAEDFEAKLARVDEALRKNPNHVGPKALNSCLRQRNFAAKLFDYNELARAERSLAYCFQVLKISTRPPKKQATGPTIEEIQAQAARELEQALTLEPNVEHGLEIYRGCAACHGPEGWGMQSGVVPQIAGQHRTVVVKQLADIRAGNRQAVSMAPYATVEVIGGTQAVADVAAYIDTLEISTRGGKGSGDALELGEQVYRESCARCHGPQGEGDAEAYVPRIQSQHYEYLVRQFKAIKNDLRRNASVAMAAQIVDFDDEKMHAVLDYVSRLAPPPELQAPEGWHNPDFAASE